MKPILQIAASERLVFSFAYSLLRVVEHFVFSGSFACFLCKCVENTKNRNGLTRIKKQVFQRPQVFLLLAALAGLLPVAAQAVAIEPGGPAAGALAVPAGAGGPRVSIQFTLVTAKPRAGEPVEFEVKFAAPPAVIWDEPVFGRTMGKWVVTRHRRGSSAVQSGYQIRKDRIWLLTYASGRVDIPSLGVRFHLPNQQEGLAPTQALSVMVEPAQGKSADPQSRLRDLKKPIGFFPWLQALWTLLLAAAVLAGIGWYAGRAGWIRARPAEPPRPPEELARERLAALRASGFLAAGQYKQYYSELTDIARHYLEGRFAIAALDRTTPELLRTLKARQFARQDAAMLREVLERADLAKFAKAKPDETEAQSDRQAVADWVERTAPVPSAATAAPGGAVDA